MKSGGRLALAALSSVLLAVPVDREGAWALGAVFVMPLLAATRTAGWLASTALGALAGVLYGIAISLWIPDALAALGSSQVAGLAGLVLVSLWGVPPRGGWGDLT